MKYIFIINPNSGGGKTANRLSRLIEEKFSNTHEHNYTIRYTEFAGHAKQIASEAVNDGFDIVVAAGGDGTVNEVCSSLINKQAAFGLLPTGSGNGFARSLSIPLKLPEAIDHLLDPDIKQIDAGKINDNFFFGVAGIGFDAEIGRKFQEFGTRGPLPYFYLGLKEYFNYEYEELILQFEDNDLNIRPLLITIANTSQYGNGAIIAPEADFSDGLLDICIVDRFSFFNGLKKLHTLFNGKINSSEFYRTFKSRQVRIVRSRKTGIFHVDGEPVLGEKILEISVIEKAINVCV